MGDKQRAIELLAAEYRKEGLYGQVDHTYGAAARAAIAAITAAMCTAPVVVRLLDLLQQWEQRAAKAHPSDAMLINKHIRELGSVIRGENLLNQRGVAVVPNGPQVVPPAALGAHEVHPEAVHAGIDLGEAGESLVAADALEHASGVRQNCDGSATAPEGFVMVPVEPSLGVLASMAIRRDHGLGCPGYYDAPVFGAENVGHQRRMEVAIGEARQQYAEVVGNGFYSLDREGHYAGLAARPQGVKDV